MKEENGVLVLTDANYDTFMEGKDTVLVEFYAPWYVGGPSLASLNVPTNVRYFWCVLPPEGAATANSLPPSMRK